MNVVGPGLELPELAKTPATTDVYPLTPKQAARLERDRQRGYSINVKQIVLAFAVEIVIIGLILTNTYLVVAQLPDASSMKIIQAMLFPIAMAMVETARVPLAVAVRTQTSWSIQLAALIGVLCAVAVTSNSLYSIGAASFNPRLEDTHKKDSLLKDLEEKKRALEGRIERVQAEVAQRVKDRDTVNASLQSLNRQLTEQPAQNCATVTIPSPAPGIPPSTQQQCRQNPVLKTLYAEITATKSKLADAEVALKQSQVQAQQASDNSEVAALSSDLSKAEAERGESVFQSQLHSLAAMLFGVDPQNVTPAQIKTLEFYLIFVSSIAAAFSSTLIAMTAIRKTKVSRRDEASELPDDAVAYIFGPLMAAIQKEAKDAVSAAIEKSNLRGQNGS
jgi:hypothetical protein